MEYNVHKERYEKLKESIKDIFEGTTEELNTRIQSYDTVLKEKHNEITEVEIYNDFLIIHTISYITLS